LNDECVYNITVCPYGFILGEDSLTCQLDVIGCKDGYQLTYNNKCMPLPGRTVEFAFIVFFLFLSVSFIIYTKCKGFKSTKLITCLIVIASLFEGFIYGLQTLLAFLLHQYLITVLSLVGLITHLMLNLFGYQYLRRMAMRDRYFRHFYDIHKAQLEKIFKVALSLNFKVVKLINSRAWNKACLYCCTFESSKNF